MATLFFVGCKKETSEYASWVDVHVHPSTNIVDLDRAGDSNEDMTFCTTSECLENYISIMDFSGTSFALLLSPPSSKKVNEETEETILEITQQYPEFFGYIGGGAVLNPMLQTASNSGEVTDEIREEFETVAREIAESGANGFGEMAVLHLSASASHPYEEVSADFELYLLLADIAAEYDIPIDIHMDPIVSDSSTPEQFLELSENNPDILPGNIEGLERLLDYNSDTKISWAHTADTTGQLTPDLVERLLEEHPNLYLSLRLEIPRPMNANKNNILDDNGQIDPEWKTVFEAFPEHFFIGSDAFIGGLTEAGRTQTSVQSFLEQLPEEVAKKISCENAVEIYNLDFGC